MKPHLDIQHVGTLGDEGRQRMTFDENSVAHLMSVLTDLYTNRALAVVREYSTNARDSHVEAGKADVPIRVTKPSGLFPVLTISDEGIGMTVDDVYERFAKYGYSSKRESDAVNGMLGLGCKAGLTYTSQFTLVARRDGVQCTVLVTRDEEGAGAVQVVDTCSTDQPNGVEVQVPVKNVAEMNANVEAFFMYWDPGTVLVDGVEPPSVWTDAADGASRYVRLDPDVVLDTQSGVDKIVMGGVAYPVPTDIPEYPLNPARLDQRAAARGDNYYRIKNDARNTSGIIARVPIGTVNFVPSREALAMSKRTKETLADAREFVGGAMWRVAQADVENAPTHLEARLRVAKYESLYDRGKFRYKGIIIPREVTLLNGMGLPWTPEYGSKKEDPAHRIERLSFKAFENTTIHVVGHKGGYMPPKFKEQCRKYLNDLTENNPKLVNTNWDYRKIFVYDFCPDLEFCDQTNIHTVSADVIREVVLPEPEKAQRVYVKWRVIHPGAAAVDDWEHDDMPEHTPVAWGSPDDFRREVTNMHALAQLIPNEKVILQIRSQDQSKFKRLFPNLPHVRQWIRETGFNLFDGVSPHELEFWYRRSHLVDDSTRQDFHNWIGACRLLNKRANEIRDPDLRELIELYFRTGNMAVDRVMKRYEAITRLWPFIDGHRFTSAYAIPTGTKDDTVVLPEPSIPRDKATRSEIGAIINRYPILTQMSSVSHRLRESTLTATLLEYVNSVYLTRVLAGHPVQTY